MPDATGGKVFYYGTVFDAIHCDEEAVTTGRPCKLVPAWQDKETGQRLCYVHAEKRFHQLKEAHDASAVRSGS